MTHAYTWKGSTAGLNVGDKVLVSVGEDEAVPAKVRVLLATQFLARTSNKEDRFFFYADKDVTWSPAN